MAKTSTPVVNPDNVAPTVAARVVRSGGGPVVGRQPSFGINAHEGRKFRFNIPVTQAFRTRPGYDYEIVSRLQFIMI